MLTFKLLYLFWSIVINGEPVITADPCNPTPKHKGGGIITEQRYERFGMFLHENVEP